MSFRGDLCVNLCVFTSRLLPAWLALRKQFTDCHVHVARGGNLKLRLSLLSLLLLCLSAIPMMAQAHVYDNGPTNGTVDAWTINFGFIVSDTFTLASARNIEGFTFAAWLFPGDILESAEVS